jgi:hypothetical protein
LERKNCIQHWRNEYCFIAVQYPLLRQYKLKLEKGTSPPLDTTLRQSTILLLRYAGSEFPIAVTIGIILALGNDAV